MRISCRRIRTILFIVAMAAVPAAAHAQTSHAKINFDLPAQPLVRALLTVGRQASVNITFDPHVVDGYHAAALKGSYTVRQALAQLLEGSGLTARTTQGGSFLIERGGGTSPSSAPVPASTYTFHLPAQSLAATLRAIRKKTGRQIELDASARAIAGKRVAAVDGTMTPLQAIQEVLINTTLRANASPDGVLTVRSQTAPSAGNIVRTLRTVSVVGEFQGLSATRTATPLREIPQSVSVLDQQRIRTQNLANLDDVMNQATGVTVVQSDMLNSDFYSRGFWIGSYHVDGGAAISPNYLNVIPPDMSEYERVEVLRGADALFGGAGTPGATVNLMRKRPHAVPAVVFDQLAGSWQTFRTQLDATGPIGLDGKLLGRVVAMYENQHFYYDTARARRRKLYGIVEYHPTPSTTLTLAGSVGLRNDVPMSTGLPRYLDGGDIHLPRSTFFGMDWQRERARSYETFVELEHSFNEKWKLKAQATRLRGYSDQLNSELNGPVQRGTGYLLGSLDAVGYTLTSTSIASNIQLSGSFDVDGWTQEMVVGVDYQDNRNSDARSYYPLAGPPLSVFDLKSYAPVPQLEFVSTAPFSLKQYGFYTAFRLRALVEGLSFTVGLRDSLYRKNATTLILAPDGSIIFQTPSRNTRVHGKPTPMFGVTYDLGKHYSVYASYADIYGPPQPNLRQANGDPFDAALDGVNLEVGAKGAWYGGLLNGSIALFKVRQSGLALQASTSSSIANCCFVSGTNRSEGFEFELDGRLARGWQVGAGYTFDINHQASLPGTEAEALQTQTPKHLLKFWTNYQLPGHWSRWSVGGDLHAQSSSYENGLVCAGPTDPVGGCLGVTTNYHVTQGFYAVMGLRVSYDLGANWQLAVNLNNVFDRVYYRTSGTPISGSWYGAPRNVMFTLHGNLW
ncbi:MAG: TonB-dependent siderophore receptor [Rhodanobacteraceae bacterium]